MSEIGCAGILPIFGFQLGWDVAGDAGFYGQQWSYPFAGTESHLATEAFLALPKARCFSGSPRFAVGWRLDWFDNESFDQLFGRPLNSENNYSVLDQRLGTPFLQCDLTGANALWRFRFEFGNDLEETFGDGGDKFRTAQVRLLCLRQSGPWQLRMGTSLDLFTGHTDRDLAEPLFADRSQGLIEVAFGLSWFHKIGRHPGELGITFAFGPDTESIRDVFQNRLVHSTLFPQNVEALVDRPNRFKTDVAIFYVWHFR